MMKTLNVYQKDVVQDTKWSTLIQEARSHLIVKNVLKEPIKTIQISQVKIVHNVSKVRQHQQKVAHLVIVSHVTFMILTVRALKLVGVTGSHWTKSVLILTDRQQSKIYSLV